MEKVVSWFKNQISVGNIAVIIFVAGGFYYTTQYEFSTLKEDIQDTDATYDQHIEYQFRPLRDDVSNNRRAIQDIQGNYQTLHELLKQQQINNQKQFERIESRLDYIINRLDRRTGSSSMPLKDLPKGD